MPRETPPNENGGRNYDDVIAYFNEQLHEIDEEISEDRIHSFYTEPKISEGGWERVKDSIIGAKYKLEQFGDPSVAREMLDRHIASSREQMRSVIMRKDDKERFQKHVEKLEALRRALE